MSSSIYQDSCSLRYIYNPNEDIVIVAPASPGFLIHPFGLKTNGTVV